MSLAFFDGPQNESLFAKPVLRFFRHNPLPELFRKTESLNDDRLLSIVTALIVEDRLDMALRSFLPRYNRLLEATDFTFSTKIALLRATAFIPSMLLSAADLLRRARNEFAHHLELESLAQLPESLRNDMINLRSAVYARFGKEEGLPLVSLLAEYKALAFFCIAGLNAYSENLSLLRDAIEQRSFVEALYQRVLRENEEQVKAITNQAPQSVESRDGQRIERFRNGVVQITVEGSPSAGE